MVELVGGIMKQPIRQDCNGLLIVAGDFTDSTDFPHKETEAPLYAYRESYYYSTGLWFTKKITFATGSRHYAEKGLRCKF